MKTSRKYLITVSLLAVLAVVFGLTGTIAPALPESGSVAPQQESSSGSVGHFQNPPSYDSGWVDIRDKTGRISLVHGLNTTNVVVDVTGKQGPTALGTFAWNRTYGTAINEVAKTVVPTVDGYVLGGYTVSPNDFDSSLVKTDFAGNLQWNRTYGKASWAFGQGWDLTQSTIQTMDGGYALAGYSNSYGAGGHDFWLIKTDSAGYALWNKTYGGTNSDTAMSVVQTSDGGYALVGYTASFGAGSYDVWLVKVDYAGTMEWNRTYGGTGYEDAYAVVQTSDGGYAIAGSTFSFGAGGSDMWLIKTDSVGNGEWYRTYGGTGSESASSLVETSDGGYALAGRTNSYGAGGNNFWLVKTDSSGTLQWSRTFGGTSNEEVFSLVQTSKGGYAIAGITNSFGAGSNDWWLIKTDSFGTQIWNRTCGGALADYAYSLVETEDEGFIVVGTTDSFGAGGTDIWLIKVNPDFGLEHQKNLGGTGYIPGWSKTYGGTNSDKATSLVQTSDGGYALAGYTYSYGAGLSDFWLVRSDDEGNMQWSKTYGGTNWDSAYSMVQTGDGGYALAGTTYSYGAGWSDFWLVKTDSSGTAQWNRTYGGALREEAYSVVQTSDGGYALAGYTGSYGAGDWDFWLVKTDGAGNMQWDKTYGGAYTDVAWSVVQTSDGGYALAGYTNSYGAGGYDFWLVKTDEDGNVQWSLAYGGANYDGILSVIQTDDGGYTLAGYTSSYGAGYYDFWLVKTDWLGGLQWNRTYGGAIDEIASSVVQTSDGGYALAGYTNSYGSGNWDFWLVKTDPTGNTQWSKTFGGTDDDSASSVVQTGDGGYAIAGESRSYGTGDYDLWLVKTGVESGLAWTDLTNTTITLERGRTDPYWNYVRVRMWLIKEPSWIYGDINMDGIVDAKDLYILSQNYGKTLSILSLTGITAIAGIRTVKKRKQNKQPGNTN